MKRIYFIVALIATTILCGCEPDIDHSKTGWDFSNEDVYANCTCDTYSDHLAIFVDKSRGAKVLYDFGDGYQEYHDPGEHFRHQYKSSGEYRLIVVAYEFFDYSRGYGKEFQTYITIQVE